MKTKELIAILALLSFALATASRLCAQSPQEINEARTLILEQQLAQQHAAADLELKQSMQNVGEASRQRAVSQDLQRQAQALAQVEQAVHSSGQSPEVTEIHDARTGTRIVTSGDGKAVRLQQIVKRSRGSEQSLVIAFSALDPGKRAELTEDLNVMAKLIDDAVADQRDPAVPKAMGISVTGLFPDGSAPRSLYIEGHGAIFQTTVRFPLRPSERKESVAAPKSAKNSPWEEARRDLYGSREEEIPGWVGTLDVKAEQYNEARVESLKKDFLKAMSNANNFRHVGRDETFTVVLNSGAAGRHIFTMPQQVRTTGGAGVASVSAGAGPRVIREESTMTIRVKKSDADALANGRITEDEFRKRATVAVY